MQQHLRILSGFYGILRLDGIVPYRLEMQAKANCRRTGAAVRRDSACMSTGVTSVPGTGKGGQGGVNLASKEYNKAIEPFLSRISHT